MPRKSNKDEKQHSISKELTSAIKDVVSNTLPSDETITKAVNTTQQRITQQIEGKLAGAAENLQNRMKDHAESLRNNSGEIAASFFRCFGENLWSHIFYGKKANDNIGKSSDKKEKDKDSGGPNDATLQDSKGDSSIFSSTFLYTIFVAGLTTAAICYISPNVNIDIMRAIRSFSKGVEK